MTEEKRDFWLEVGRKSHELVVSHGARNAPAYAQKLASQALAEGEVEAHKFWEAVWGAIRPRQISN